jgi:glucose/arabinose dehydrogenase
MRLATLLATTALLAAPALAQNADDASEGDQVMAQPAEAEPTPLDDQELGKTFHVRPQDLPEPYASEAVRNPAVIVERKGRKPNVPDGFQITLFAEDLQPRQMLVRENGDVIVAEQYQNELVLLRDNDGDGHAEIVSHFAQGFEQPYGLAMNGEGDLLVADVRGIWRAPTYLGAVRASGGEIFAPKKASEVPEDERRPQTPMDHFAVTAQGVFGDPTGHTTRSLVRNPETGDLTVGVGSAGNISIEPPMRASIQRFDADGTNQRTVVEGVRNPVGLDFHPETGQLWTTVQERDGLGNKLVPDFMAPVEMGADYGFPHAYIGSNPQPDFAERNPERVDASMVPPLLFEAHSAAMSFAFYDGDSFPQEYYGDAIVPLKGSWNRADPTGYKVVRVHFEDGRPTGTYENFVTGFWVSGDERAEVWGRPADVDVMPDGSVLIADDTGGTIWRVTYSGETGHAEAADAAE